MNVVIFQSFIIIQVNIIAILSSMFMTALSILFETSNYWFGLSWIIHSGIPFTVSNDCGSIIIWFVNYETMCEFIKEVGIMNLS